MSGKEGYSIIYSDESAVSDRIEGKFKAAVICWLLGTGAAFTWNTILCISEYYYIGSPDHYPSSVLTLIYEAVALGTMMLYAHYEAKLNTNQRVLWGYFFSYACTLVFFLVEFTVKGAPINYRGLCVLVGFYGVFDASIQGGLVGDLSLMDPTFLQSFLAGLATSGALTSLLKLAVFDKNDDGRRAGTIRLFLLISGAYQFFCLVLYGFVLVKIPIVKHYRKKAALEGSKTVLTDLEVAGIDVHQQNVNDEQDPDWLSKKTLMVNDDQDPDRLSKKTLMVNDDQDPHRLSKKILISQNLDLVLDLCLIAGLTFFIFPGFIFKNTTHNQSRSWYGVVLVALYNIFDVMGRCVTMRLESRKGLMVACLLRLLLIPCFYFTATYGGRGWMIVLVASLGLTNGYLTVCAFAVALKGYRAPEQNALGNLLFVFLLGGAFSGAILDYLWACRSAMIVKTFALMLMYVGAGVD